MSISSLRPDWRSDLPPFAWICPWFSPVLATVASLSLVTLLPSAVLAQAILPATDGTGSQVIQTGNQFDISGGTRSGNGANLFHSFQRFGLGPDQVANFRATPDLQAILGRVTGGDPSVIEGLIRVSGGTPNLFLINPAGFLFGPTARLDVPAAFHVTTATAVGLGDRWFSASGPNAYAALEGTPDRLAWTVEQPGAIANLGTLAVAPGQTLSLTGGTVLNTGQLLAPGGQLAIAAVPGQTWVRLSQPDRLLNLEFQAVPTAPFANPWTLPTTTLPQLLTGSPASNATGITVNPDGSVQLSGSGLAVPTANGVAILAGDLNASQRSGGQGGAVTVVGDRLALIDAQVDVSGTTGGGTVRIGGDYQGQGPLPNAQSTYSTTNTVIQADALTQGNGGQVVVWADGHTRFAGQITARGGSLGGNGGLVETSGKATLDVSEARVDASAPQGTAGTWLLDPTDITIGGLTATGFLVNGVFDPPTSSVISPATIAAAMDGGTNVTITTAGGTGGNGDITLAQSINQTGGGSASLTLTGRRFILSGGTINLTTTDSLTFNLNQVNPEATPTIASIQNAVNAIGSVVGDRIINLGAGTYAVAGASTLAIDRSVIINGTAAANTLLTGANLARVITVSGGTVTLNQLTIQDGNSASGGGVAVTGAGTVLNLNNSIVANNVSPGVSGGIDLGGGTTVRLANSRVTGNVAAGSGGGIQNNGGTLDISANSLIANNRANFSGGGIANTGVSVATIRDSTISDNQTDIAGGGIVSSGTLTVTNSTLSGNTALRGGGGIFANNFSLTNTTITGNNGGSDGGGITQFDGVATVTGSQISNNTADVGGGIHAQGGTLTLSQTTLSNNVTADQVNFFGTGFLIPSSTVFINNGTVNFANQSAIVGGVNGVFVAGNLVGTLASLGDTRFVGQSDRYIVLGRAVTQTLDATGASFDGVTGTNGTVAQLLAVTDKITDGLDTTGGGFVRLKANTVFVPLGSSLQTAVNLASDGDTINVAGGTYSEPAGLENSKNLTFLAAGDFTFNSNILTSTSVNLGASGNLILGNIQAPGQAVRLTGSTVTVGDIDTVSSTGGSVTIIAQDQITAGFIQTSGFSGDGGAVFLDPTGDIQVTAINATGAVSGGRGGTVQIATDRFFRATGSFTDQDGVSASISTTGGLGGGAISLVTNRGGLDVPFLIGDATLHGTAGAITTGLSNRLTPAQSIQGPFVQGTAPSIRIVNGVSRVVLTPTPTPPPQPVEPPSDTFRELKQGPDATLPTLTNTEEQPLSLEASAVADMEAELTSEFTDYLELPEEPDPISLPESQSVLAKVEQSTGVKPALIYVNFALQPTLKAQVNRASVDPISVDRTSIVRSSIDHASVDRTPIAGTKQLAPAFEKTGDRPTAIITASTTIGNTIDSAIEITNTPQLELLVVTSTGQPIRRSVPVTRSQILAIAQQFRNEVADPSKVRTRSYRPAAQQLYQWLIAPIAADLQARNIGNLAFIMDSGLRFIPLAALHDGQQFLVEQYSIGLMPSLSLTNTRVIDLQQARVLGGGAAQFAEQNPLPAVAVELAAINQSWAGESLLNDRFTRANLRQRRQERPFGIVHLSTHGEFLPGALGNSYIQLQDEKLRLNQIRDMGWNNPPVDLLVLSACRMALGDQDYNAELGFAGFAVQAGAASAIASLWNVSDEGSAGLMAEFYQKLRQSPIKADALRQAQLAMLRGQVVLQGNQLRWSGGQTTLPAELVLLGDRVLSHPYYWSAFTLIGSPW
jgi:filamentous hemagglutinin family protein